MAEPISSSKELEEHLASTWRSLRSSYRDHSSDVERNGESALSAKSWIDLHSIADAADAIADKCSVEVALEFDWKNASSDSSYYDERALYFMVLGHLGADTRAVDALEEAYEREDGPTGHILYALLLLPEEGARSSLERLIKSIRPGIAGVPSKVRSITGILAVIGDRETLAVIEQVKDRWGGYGRKEFSHAIGSLETRLEESETDAKASRSRLELEFLRWSMESPRHISQDVSIQIVATRVHASGMVFPLDFLRTKWAEAKSALDYSAKLAIALAGMQKEKGAVEDLRALIPIDSHGQIVIGALVSISTPEAVGAIEDAISAAPSFPTLNRRLAGALSQIGNRDSAQRLLGFSNDERFSDPDRTMFESFAKSILDGAER